jgi:hypothetical protein
MTVAGYALNDWPSAGLSWPDAPVEVSASFTTQITFVASDSLQSQVTTTGQGSYSLNNQVSLMRSRQVRSQFRVLLYEHIATNYQIFLDIIYKVVLGGVSYCKSPWPSDSWPYSTAWALSLHSSFLPVISKSSYLGTQFEVEGNLKSKLRSQFVATPLGSSSLYVGINVAATLDVTHGISSLKSQWEFAHSNRTYFEVRWRPF